MTFQARCRTYLVVVIALAPPISTGAQENREETDFQSLFPQDGAPAGWVVRAWDDVSQPAPEGAAWIVKEGVLYGSEPRGTWLMWEREVADFELKFDFKLGPRGNSGCALRAPFRGDPAFDGLELQMADLRYNQAATPAEQTGGLYRAVAPTEQAYKPEQWNRYHISMHGRRAKVVLNGQTVLELDLDQQHDSVLRHDGSPAPPLKDRPRRGHLGFQELSRGGDQVQIRNARIKILR